MLLWKSSDDEDMGKDKEHIIQSSYVGRQSLDIILHRTVAVYVYFVTLDLEVSM